MAMQLITDITLELTGDERLYMASAKQGDKRTRFIRIALTNNGKVFTIPTGYIVIANIKKPDKHFCYNECTVTDNKVMVELTNQALAASGTHKTCMYYLHRRSRLRLKKQTGMTLRLKAATRSQHWKRKCSSTSTTSFRQRMTS